MEPIRILFICHGNICRSTMAEYVMRDLVEKCGMTKNFQIDSAATSQEELGNGVHPGTRKKLAQEHIYCGNHRARQMSALDYERYDYIIGMDEENLAGMYRLLLGEHGFGWSWDVVSPALAAKADPQHKVSLLLDWTDSPRDIADPWYTGNFDATFEDVSAGCQALLAQLMD